MAEQPVIQHGMLHANMTTAHTPVNGTEKPDHKITGIHVAGNMW